MAHGRALLPAALLLLLALAWASPAAASLRGLSQANENTTTVNTAVESGWYLGRASWWVAR